MAKPPSWFGCAEASNVCCAQIESSNFSQNTAKSSGSVLLADDDSQISFTSSILTDNGNYSCYDPPTVSCRCAAARHNSLLGNSQEVLRYVQHASDTITRTPAFMV